MIENVTLKIWHFGVYMFLWAYVHLYVNTCVRIYMWRPENTLRFYSQECHVPETGSLSDLQLIKHVNLGGQQAP